MSLKKKNKNIAFWEAADRERQAGNPDIKVWRELGAAGDDYRSLSSRARVVISERVGEVPGKLAARGESGPGRLLLACGREGNDVI